MNVDDLAALSEGWKLRLGLRGRARLIMLVWSKMKLCVEKVYAARKYTLAKTQKTILRVSVAPQT